MPSFIYQDTINLIVHHSIRTHSSVPMNVVAWENCTLDN